MAREFHHVGPRGADAYGAAATGALLTPVECAELVAGDDVPAAFRSRVVMARHGLRRSC